MTLGVSSIFTCIIEQVVVEEVSQCGWMYADLRDCAAKVASF